MGDIGDLDALAHALLDACIEALDTIPAFDATLKGAPDRTFVSPGNPVADCCEQLAVHVPIIGEADTSPGGLNAGKRYATARINHVGLLATITRCVPTGVESPGGDYRPPSPSSLSAAAAQIDADGWALWNHLFNLQSSGLLLSLCDEVFFDGITAAAPSGGCGGWQVAVRAYLGGYSESFST